MNAPAASAVLPTPTGSVALIGAGPGDPGLITVRGLQWLRAADVVIHDRLCGVDLLAEAPPHALLIDAGKRPGRHTLSQEQINQAIVEHARLGRRVVRLKGGDPFIYGRGHEELAACRDAGIACEVAPGVTSAIAAPAAVGVPVTLRGVARTFAIVTPQSESGAERVPLDYTALATIETVSVLMGVSVLAEVCAGFIAAGRSPQTPAAVIADATLPGQRAVAGTLATIERLAAAASIAPPAVLVIGEVARLAETRPPAIERPPEPAPGPLAGRRILVTRPASASPPLTALLQAHGARVIECPLIRIEYIDPHDDDVMHRLGTAPLACSYGWLAFTSLHGVRGFWRVLRSLGLDARALAGVSIAAVGPKTSAELASIGLSADLVPEIHRASELVRLLPRAAGAGAGVLFPCGTLARDELRSGLRAAGLTVDELEVYDTRTEAPSDAVRRLLAAGGPGVDAAVLYSPSAAASAAAAGLNFGTAVVACIGPTTAAAARRHGYFPTVVPESHTDAGLVEALCAALATPAPAPAASAVRPLAEAAS